MIKEIETHIKDHASEINLEDLWNEYITASFLHSHSSINEKNLSEFDDRMLMFILRRLEKTIKKLDDKNYVIIKIKDTPLSNNKKTKILLYPGIALLIESRNKSIANFSKLKGGFFKDSLFFLSKYFIYAAVALLAYGYFQNFDFEKEYDKYAPTITKEFTKHSAVVEKELTEKYNAAESLSKEMAEKYKRDVSNSNVNTRD